MNNCNMVMLRSAAIMQVIEEAARDEECDDETIDAPKGNIRKGIHSFQKTASDEDSDFDD